MIPAELRAAVGVSKNMSAGQFGKPSRYAINATDSGNYPYLISYSNTAVFANVCFYHHGLAFILADFYRLVAVFLTLMKRGFKVICVNSFAFFDIACGFAYAKTVLYYALPRAYIAKSLLVTCFSIYCNVVCGIYPYKAHERASL